MIYDTDIERWLREDVGHHDVTNDLSGSVSARLVATEDGILAGIDAAVAVFEYLGVETNAALAAGVELEAGDVVLRTTGPARDVLRGERVAVNLVAHASGIATRTRRAVDAARAVDDAVRIAGTRKTTPGLRGLEKRAVAAGGGDTHRLDMSHMAMVKDNHIADLGLERAVTRIRERTSFSTQVEVEVEAPAEALRAVEAGADIVLLDNMSPGETATAVEELSASSVLTEASGGIDVADVSAYAETGVDIISLGSLTHSAPALDYSFRVGQSGSTTRAP